MKQRRRFYTQLICATLWLNALCLPLSYAEEKSLLNTKLPESKAVSDANITAAQNIVHDSQASQAVNDKNKEGLISKCQETPPNRASQKYQAIKTFNETMLAQNLELIKKQRQITKAKQGILATAEGNVSANPSSMMPGGMASGNVAKEKKAMESANIERKKADQDLKKMEAAYKVASSKCIGTTTCSSTNTSGINRAFKDLAAAQDDYLQKQQDEQKAIDAYDKKMQPAATVSDGFASGMQLEGALGKLNANDDKNRISHNKSQALTVEYEKLKEMVNKTTWIAADLAAAKSKESAALSRENKFSADYELFVAAVGDGSQNSQTANAMVASNVEVLGNATAATKHLSCNPIDDTDSKSYHLFRAASATYLAAQINDTADNNKNSLCKFYEDSNKSEEYDEQIKAVERAANLYGQIVDATKLKIATNTDALNMYNSALLAAQSELSTKRQRVSMADQQVKKGEKWIKKTIRDIIVTIALKLATMMAKIKAEARIAQAEAMIERGYIMLESGNTAGWALVDKGTILKIFWTAVKVAKKALLVLFIARLAWLANDLRRAYAFTKKWKKKLKKAKKHSHMACNYGKAAGEEAEQKAEAKAENDKAEAMIQAEITRINVLLEAAVDLPSPQYRFYSYLRDQLQEALNILMPAAQAAKPTAPPTALISAQDTTGGLGIATGATSFEGFITKKMEGWKNQAKDASGLVNLDALVVDTTGLSPEDNTGFPLPETRVTTIGNAISALSGNIDLLSCTPLTDTSITRAPGTWGFTQQPACYKAIQIRDTYVTLLNQMRKRMPLGVQGLTDDQLKKVDLPVQNTAPCINMGTSAGGSNSCFKLEYPTFKEMGSIDPLLKSQIKLTFAAATATLGGNTAEATLANASLAKDAQAVRQRINQNKIEINKIRAKAGLSPRNFDSESHLLRRRAAELAASSYQEQYPLLAKLENNNIANDYSHSYFFGLDEDKGLAKKRKGKKVASIKPKVAKTNNLLPTKDQKPSETLATQEEELEHTGGIEMEISDEGYIHHNRQIKDKKSKDGIIKDREISLFKAISRRYFKSAMPIFMRKKTVDQF